MPHDEDVDRADRPWPPAFSTAFVERMRSRLEATSVLVVVGPPGNPRDRLASDVAGLDQRPARTRHVARRGEDTIAFFALDQLWRRADSTTAYQDADADSIEAEMRRELARATQPPQVVLVNAEFCDPESLDVLTRIARTGDIQLIATIAPEAVSTHEQLMAMGDLVEIAQLDAPELTELLRARFDAEPDPALIDLVLERTGGSYELTRHLVDASLAAGAIGVRDHVLRIDPSHTGAELAPSPLVTNQSSDGRPLTDLVDVTSLLGHVHAAEARQRFGPAVVDLVTTSGMLSLKDDALVSAFPEAASSARHTMDRDRQCELFDRYAHDLPLTIAMPFVAPRAADWWRAAGHPLPIDLAARAARAANLQGRYRRTLVYSDPANNDEHATIVPVERGFALIELGAADDFVALFRGIDPHGLSEEELYAYLRAVTMIADAAERDQLVHRAIAVDDLVARRRREAVRTLADLVHLTMSRSSDRASSRLRALAFSGQLSPGNRAVAFAALSAAMRHSAHPYQAVQASEFALEILADENEHATAFYLETTHEVHIAALLSALDLFGAERALEVYSAGGGGVPGGGRLRTVLQAHVRMQRGEVRDALASAQQFLTNLGPLDTHELRGLIEAVSAECLVHLGCPTEALEALDAASRHPSRIPHNDLQRRITMAAARDGLAEPEDALEMLNGVIDEAYARGLLLVRIEAAAQGVMIGGPPQLDRLLEAVDDLVDPGGTPQIWQRFARAASDYDIPKIVELAVELEAKDARLIAAGVAQFVLDMARRATDLDDQTRSYLSELADLSGSLAS